VLVTRARGEARLVARFSRAERQGRGLPRRLARDGEGALHGVCVQLLVRLPCERGPDVAVVRACSCVHAHVRRMVVGACSGA